MTQIFDPFYGEAHKQRIETLERLWKELKNLSLFASQFGINDIFQDNGAKVLQQLIYLNMKAIPGREGNDAVSASGKEWEMKSINLATTASGFSTNHHTTLDILQKFRSVPWVFSIYNGIDLQQIYIMAPYQLETIFSEWEKKLQTQSHLNNPKISVSFVKHNGIQIFPINENHPIDPDIVV